MKKFHEWLKERAQNEGFGNLLPNIGQRAIPINQTGPQAQPSPGQAAAGPAGQGTPPGQPPTPGEPKRISLSTFADQISDPNWLQLYEIFTRQFQKTPQDPEVGKLGMALYQSAQSGDMSGLQPFVAKHLHAQPMK